MKLLSTDSYIDFECIGGNCPISCCGGDWSIIVDKKSAEYYRSVDGEFGDRLRNNLLNVDGINIFKLDENGDCPFLDGNKLCSIYKTLGADKICYTCKVFPRELMQVGDILLCSLDNSCPEVTRMIIQRTNPVEILFDDSEGNVAEYPENSSEYEKTDWKSFNYAIRAFSTGMNLLQNQNISLGARLFLLLMFISRFQELMKKEQNPTDITGVFSTPDVYTIFLENSPISERDYSSKIRAFIIVFGNLMTEAYDHPMWGNCKQLASDISEKGVSDIDALKSAFDRMESKEIQSELEKLMVYRFFSAFMRGYEKSEYMEVLAYECVMYAALITYMALTGVEQGHMCMQEERILFYTLCARIGHSKIRFKNMTEAIRREGFYNMDRLLMLIS